MKLNIIGGFQDTRTNHEDFALTPFLYLVFVNKISKAFGLGLCWGHCAVFLGISINAPKGMPRFMVVK